MPPRNPGRSRTREALLAERVAALREENAWSYEGLAKRMTDVGCPIQPSALFKIETETADRPRRRIVVDELVALSKVFNVSVESLVALPGESAAQDAADALVYVWQRQNKLESTRADLETAQYWLPILAEQVDRGTAALFEALDLLTADDAAAVLREAGSEWGDQLRSEYTAHCAKRGRGKARR